MPRTQIFQLGEDISVVTDAAEERDFLEGLSEAIGELQNGTPLRPILEAGVDIVCKFRGYKTGVMERRILAAGRWPHPSEEPIAEVGEPADEEASKA